jgi:hypothetical protein
VGPYVIFERRGIGLEQVYRALRNSPALRLTFEGICEAKLANWTVAQNPRAASFHSPNRFIVNKMLCERGIHVPCPSTESAPVAHESVLPGPAPYSWTFIDRERWLESSRNTTHNALTKSS